KVLCSRPQPRDLPDRMIHGRFTPGALQEISSQCWELHSFAADLSPSVKKKPSLSHMSFGIPRLERIPTRSGGRSYWTRLRKLSWAFCRRTSNSLVMEPTADRIRRFGSLSESAILPIRITKSSRGFGREYLLQTLSARPIAYSTICGLHF